jgi:MFS transporter, DHA1 family, multidrug resistance protein
MEPWKRNLYLIWTAQVLSLTGFGFGLPFIPYYFQELGVTDAQQLKLLTGISASLPALLMGGMALVWGMLADKIGRKMMMLRALASGALIVGGMGLAQNAGTVLVLRGAQGLLTGTMTAAITMVASGTPRAKLSYALGMIASSNFVGISFGPFIGGFTAELLGYRTSFFIGGAVLVCAFFLVLFGVRELGTDDGEQHQVQEAGERFSWASLLCRPLLICFFLIFCMQFVRFLTQPFLPLYLQEMIGKLEGASIATGTITGLAGLASAAAGLTLARLGDSRDPVQLIKIFLIAAVLVSIPLTAVSSVPLFALFLVIMMFFLGGVEPLINARIGAQVPAKRRGIVFGTQTFFGSFGWFVAPMVGSSISVTYGLKALFIGLSITLFVTFLMAAAASRSLRSSG